MAGSSAIHFARAARRSGMMTRTQLVRDGLEHLRFRMRGSTDAGTQELLDRVTEQLRGVPEREVANLAPEILAGILPRVYPRMLDEVREQDAGRPAFIVSAAGDGLVELLARILLMEGGIGTRYEVGPDGRFTGRLDGPFTYGEGKVVAMRRFADEHEIDLDPSHAYSDSASDLPMLRAVGNPVAVNPDPELAAIAGEEGWRVMRIEKIGQRLGIAAATLVAAAVGGSGTLLAARRRPRRRIPVPVRRRRGLERTSRKRPRGRIRG